MKKELKKYLGLLLYWSMQTHSLFDRKCPDGKTTEKVFFTHVCKLETAVSILLGPMQIKITANLKNRSRIKLYDLTA
jgi:hypothetical protein